MRGRLAIAFVLPLMVGNAGAQHVELRSTTAEVSQAAVDVGHVFGRGGTDGLILYALVLSTFLMFIVAMGALWLSMRLQAQRTRSTNAAFAAKDAHAAEKDKLYIDQMNRTADAVNALSVAIAGEIQERALTRETLARMEATDGQLRALLEDLRHVP